MKTVRAFVRALAAVLAVLTGTGVAVLATAAPASAHAQLVSSDPKDGDSLAEAPASAELVFSERIDGPSTQLAVTDAKGAVVPTKPFAVDGTRLTVPLDLPAAGVYTLGYRLVSEDGHRVEGKIRFEVKAGTPGSTNTPAKEPAAGSPTGQDAAGADGTGGGAGKSSTIYWLLGGLGLVVVIAVVVVVTRRRPAPRP